MTSDLEIKVGKTYKAGEREIRKVLSIYNGLVVYVASFGTLFPGWDAGPLKTIPLDDFRRQVTGSVVE